MIPFAYVLDNDRIFFCFPSFSSTSTSPWNENCRRVSTTKIDLVLVMLMRSDAKRVKRRTGKSSQSNGRDATYVIIEKRLSKSGTTPSNPGTTSTTTMADELEPTRQ